MKNLKAFVGYGQCTYLEICLKEIQLVKELFVLDLEQGHEVMIPSQLDQNNLSLSFKFYDPILKLILESCSRNKKEFFILSNKLNLERFQDDDDLKRKFKDIFGID